MQYLIVVPVAAFPIDREHFAMESAFCDHLKQLLALLQPTFTHIVVAAVGMSAKDFAKNRAHLGELDWARDHIRLEVLYDQGVSSAEFFFRQAPATFRKLRRLVADSGLVHAGPSANPLRPIEIASLAFAQLEKKPSIAITDIDKRDDAEMLRRAGRLSKRSYLMNRLIWDPIRHRQQQVIARTCSLVLVKGRALVRDYGRDDGRVREIRDPGFEAHQIVSEAALNSKIERLKDSKRPIELIYFGRYVVYKGVSHMIEAFARATNLGAHARLHLMGSGDLESEYRRQISDAGIKDKVQFHQPVRYGEAFFAKIRKFDLLLAAPLSVDTPRSAWDAIASGLGIVAYDTEFYAGLAESLGVVDTVPWGDRDELARRILHYDRNRDALCALVGRCPSIARQNTQTEWLKRRADWTLEMLP